MSALRRLVDSTGFHAVVQNRVVVIFVAVFAVSAIVVPGFIDVNSARLSLDRMATMGLIAIGLVVILVLGHLDLSGGAIAALTGIAAIGLQPALGQIPAAIAGLLVGVLCGAVNGFIVVVLRINSLVATLATMVFFRALCHAITNSQPLNGIDVMFGLQASRPILGSFSLRVWIFFILIVALHFWLTRTVAGRNLFAVGSNAVSARASGIHSDRYAFFGFVFAGTMAGLAGVIFSIGTNTGSPVWFETLVLSAIAAIVIGGTRLEGGRGSALGALGGLLIMAMLVTAMEFRGVPAYVQDIVMGAILLLLILLDRFVSSQKRRDVSLPALLRGALAKRSSREYERTRG